jgi:hypothetical protein
VRGNREQQQAGTKPRLLEQAAAPAHARDRAVIADPGAVGGERQLQVRRHMGHDLVASVRPRSDHRRRPGAVDRVEQAARPRRRGVGGEALVLGHVGGRHPVGAELRGGLAAALAHEQRAERLPGRQLAGERERLERELVDLTGLVLDQR